MRRRELKGIGFWRSFKHLKNFFIVDIKANIIQKIVHRIHEWNSNLAGAETSLVIYIAHRRKLVLQVLVINRSIR